MATFLRSVNSSRIPRIIQRSSIDTTLPLANADPILEYLDENGFHSVFVRIFFYYNLKERYSQKVIEGIQEQDLYALKIILNSSYNLNDNNGVFYFSLEDSTKFVYSINLKKEEMIRMTFDIFKKYIADPSNFLKGEVEIQKYVKISFDEFLKKKISAYSGTMFNKFIKIKEQYTYLYTQEVEKYTDVYTDEIKEHRYIDYATVNDYLSHLMKTYTSFLQKKYKKNIYLDKKITINGNIYNINISIDIDNIFLIPLEKDGITMNVIAFQNSKKPYHFFVPRYNLYILVTSDNKYLFVVKYDKKNLKLLQKYRKIPKDKATKELMVNILEKDIKYYFFKLLFGKTVKDLEVLADVSPVEAEQLDSNSPKSTDVKLLAFETVDVKDVKLNDVKKTSKIPSLVSNFSLGSTPASLIHTEKPKQNNKKTASKRVLSSLSNIFGRLTRRNNKGISNRNTRNNRITVIQEQEEEE